MICSIIIRACNEERHIGRLLEGIARQELPEGWKYEVIVVDSGSTDATVSIARHMGARVVPISKEEFSFGKALNVGCAQAQGDILLIASAHVYPVYKDWISTMLSPFTNERVALVYGRQTGDDRTHFSEQQVFDQWYPPISNYNQQHPFCNNANCAIRRVLWEELPYDETLTGLEDLDWAQKVKAKGHTIVYEADAVIVHVHEESPQQVRNRYQREAIAMKRIVPHVHVGLSDFLRLFASGVLSDCSQARQKRLLYKELWNIFVFRFMQYYGTYLGHRQRGDVSDELRSRFYYPGTYGSNSKPHLDTSGNRESQKIEY